MLNVFTLVLLLVYFWYFYYTDSKPPTPPKISGPDPAPVFDLTYNRLQDNEFGFHVNGYYAWQQTVPSYFVEDAKIQEMDDCQHIFQDGQKIPARGLSLYNFVKKNPKFNMLTHAYTDEGYISRHGTPFYFTCKKRRISALTLCAPGQIFSNGDCKSIDSCTGRPDNMRLPHPDPQKYIQCQDGEEHVKWCVPGEVFHGGNCVKISENLCMFQKELAFSKLDDFTLFGCQNYKPIYKTCSPGTRLLDPDSTVCEPSDCFGEADGTRIALRKRKRSPFEYYPGYSVCRQGRVAESVECPQFWDAALATQENLTMLPMVFDKVSQDCVVPSLCENVLPTEPDIHVQEHQYTREIQNWFYSKFYDQGRGYHCDSQTGLKKVDYVPIGTRINDHFKVVEACPEGSQDHLPISGYLRAYYDCSTKSFQECEDSQTNEKYYFNGSRCQWDPSNERRHVFKYDLELPVFELNSLDSEGWIKPHDKLSGVTYPDTHCEPGYEFIKTYNICSDKLCLPYVFLSTIPDLSLFTPRDQGHYKCKFDTTHKHLRKEETQLKYTFWDQKVHHPNEIIPQPEKCDFNPEKHIETGNYIWDRTVFVTCNKNQPFVFCPSLHARQIQEVAPDTYACMPSLTYKFRHTDVSQFTKYPINQFQRVLRINNQLTSVQLNKAKILVEVPENGLEIPKHENVNIKSLDPVDLEYRYRMTYPPHVIFEYKNGIIDVRVADDPLKMFNMLTEEFEYGKFDFPTYQITTYLDKITTEYNP